MKWNIGVSIEGKTTAEIYSAQKRTLFHNIPSISGTNLTNFLQRADSLNSKRLQLNFLRPTHRAALSWWLSTDFDFQFRNLGSDHIYRYRRGRYTSISRNVNMYNTHLFYRVIPKDQLPKIFWFHVSRVKHEVDPRSECISACSKCLDRQFGSQRLALELSKSRYPMTCELTVLYNHL